MGSQPKISVIVPVYNTEKYLRQCLDSILAQSLKEIEIICIDDGSTDSSLNILHEYEIHDQRIKAIHQSHSNLGVARNQGLDIAEGEYVLFLDADDFFETTLAEKTYKKAQETGADIVLFGGKRYNTVTDSYSPALHFLHKELLLTYQNTFSRKDIPEKLFQITSPCVWTKLFRRDFLLRRAIRFQSVQIAEDIGFTYTALSLARAISYVGEELVYYRIARTTNNQSYLDKQPTIFLEALTFLYRRLNSEGLYAEVEKSFLNAVISNSAYNLDTVKRAESRVQIYKRLLTPPFTDIGLFDHPIEYYDNKLNAARVLKAKSAIEWYEKLKLPADSHFQVVVDNRPKSSPCVSVIIPVYNTASYLKESLDSICRQTLTQIEVICVNDGSTDESMKILLEYAQTDNRILVGSQENCGQSSARNNGLALARGKYLYFMDSDDVLDTTALETLYKNAEEKSLDVLYFDGTSFLDSEPFDGMEDIFRRYEYYYSRSFDYGDKVYSGEDLLIQMVQHKELRCSVCLQLISGDHFCRNKLCFQEGILHEDELFNYKSMFLAQRVSHLPQKLFHRRIRKESTMTSKKSFANACGYFICYLRGLQFYATQDIKDRCEEAFQPIRALLRNCRNIYQQLSPDEKQLVYVLPHDQYQLFNLYVLDVCSEKNKVTTLRQKRERLECRKEELESRVKQLEQENKRLKQVKEKLTEGKDKLKREKVSTEKELAQSLSREAALKKSISFRVGRAATWIPRRIRDCLK